MLRLTDEQEALLLAMAAAVHTRVSRRVAWIGRRPYAVADLYALRTAGLVRSSEIRKGARDIAGFELTDRGAAEAHHRSQAASQQTDQAGTATC